MTPEQLQKKREALKLSRAKLGLAVGRTERQVGNWETGTTPIPHWLPVLLKSIEGEGS